MYLRDLYPGRNILAVQETPSVFASTLQDTLKKTDGAVSIVGEVATDDVAERMIQTAQVASLYTIFSHHAVTSKDLVMAIRNSLVNAGGFSSTETAEKQVLDVLKVDVHMDYTPDGRRFIDRITEIIPLPQSVPYPDYDASEHDKSMGNLTREYYTRKTDRVNFVTKDILRYDLNTDTYQFCGWFSDVLHQYMFSRMDGETAAEFSFCAERAGAV